MENVVNQIGARFCILKAKKGKLPKNDYLKKLILRQKKASKPVFNGKDQLEEFGPRIRDYCHTLIMEVKNSEKLTECTSEATL